MVFFFSVKYIKRIITTVKTDSLQNRGMEMKKRLIALGVCICMLAGMFTGCGKGDVVDPEREVISSAGVDLSSEGKVFNIYCWTDEFKNYCEIYYFGTQPISDPDGSVASSNKSTGDEVWYEGAVGVPEGVTINWIINPSDDGIYQDKLDAALLAQADADPDDRVDMFLVEADYIMKYSDTEYTADITQMGVTDFSNAYPYTVQACTSSDGKIKGVSFQCCPCVVIYRRSIALDVLGTDDPEEVQQYLSDWDKFDETAALAKEHGYYMVSSFVATYRAFANNMTSAWVDENNYLNIDENIQAWIDQTDKYVANEYCLTSNIWDFESTSQMFADGKTMCFFGPAWYFNFSMGNAQDPDRGCFGDWAICEGPMPHFWGGTWLLAATGTDNPGLVADIMNTFINDEEVCARLVSEQNQFSNNMLVNESFANDPDYGVPFLGGQNATAVFCELADDIQFTNTTIYDQLCNSGIQKCLQEYWKGQVSKEDAMYNFYIYLNEKYPGIITPQ